MVIAGTYSSSLQVEHAEMQTYQTYRNGRVRLDKIYSMLKVNVKGQC